ncbi:BNR-4 repeat-containing protein [Glaciecola sp. SC05]|uniref:BNR-4 repeat-containing protein n=1 Tax=Glaciecola sp. SC05 TaxID=1987355 RepID=UPI003527A95A
MKKIFIVAVLTSSLVDIALAHAQQNFISRDGVESKEIEDRIQISMSEDEFLKKRTALIIKHSHHDNTFAALQKAMEDEDTLSGEFWRWKIDQYLYGQYTEFQPIYDAYKQGRTFLDIYDIPNDPFIDRADPAPVLPKLPDGYFSGYLPMNRTPGESHYADGKIYVAYEGDLTDPYIASYDVETNQWEGPYKAGHNTLSKNGRKTDGHGNPTMQQDVDGYFHITFGGHGGEREDGLNPLSIDTAHAGGRFTHVVSDKPNDISSFSQKHDVSPFASYAESSKMPNGDMYFFTRAGTHKSPWVYYKLKSGSQTFDPPVIITWPTSHKNDPMKVDMFYIKIFKASDTDILVTAMNHLCNFKEIHTKRHDDRFNAYYMRLDTNNDTFYNVKGDKLTLPITKTQADKHTLVYDSVSAGTIVNDTRGLVLQDGKPAMSYELRFPEPREWKMATFAGNAWKTGQPMPGTTVWTLADSDSKPIDAIVSLEELSSDGKKATAAVIYKNSKKETVFAIAKSNKSTGVVGQNWVVESDHLALTGAGMQMKTVRNDAGDAVGVVVNVSKGKARRLYLWHDGKIRPRL